ncbi:hypothetical protein FOZ62_004029 [Perkinsus olseni]|uniref:Uncharacterized protein n=1 Tax=Perkinsus olseni TaxID=32597 RepID=A0A7J6RYD5_PEROL|nr:hypothetical protein FOZ62_004029 [Perkinsus olseni]
MYRMKASTPRVPIRLLQDLHHELPHGASDNAENTVVFEQAVVAHLNAMLLSPTPQLRSRQLIIANLSGSDERAGTSLE